MGMLSEMRASRRAAVIGDLYIDASRSEIVSAQVTDCYASNNEVHANSLSLAAGVWP